MPLMADRNRQYNALIGKTLDFLLKCKYMSSVPGCWEMSRVITETIETRLAIRRIVTAENLWIFQYDPETN